MLSSLHVSEERGCARVHLLAPEDVKSRADDNRPAEQREWVGHIAEHHIAQHNGPDIKVY